jgi:transcriptional regulator with XRE-family HTH domain
VERKTLGQVLRELREKEDLALREAAREIGISAPFLSDIELGRRYPSDDVLAKLAKRFKVPMEQLREYDTRESIGSLRELVTNDPSWGFAFRTMAEKAKEGKISPEELLRKIKEKEK